MSTSNEMTAGFVTATGIVADKVAAAKATHATAKAIADASEKKRAMAAKAKLVAKAKAKANTVRKAPLPKAKPTAADAAKARFEALKLQYAKAEMTATVKAERALDKGALKGPARFAAAKAAFFATETASIAATSVLAQEANDTLGEGWWNLASGKATGNEKGAAKEARAFRSEVQAHYKALGRPNSFWQSWQRICDKSAALCGTVTDAKRERDAAAALKAKADAMPGAKEEAEKAKRAKADKAKSDAGVTLESALAFLTRTLSSVVKAKEGESPVAFTNDHLHRMAELDRLIQATMALTK